MTKLTGADDQKATRLPLLVQFIFHPKSTACRDLARHLHRQLNDDIVVPGLRIPTVFCPVIDGERPPVEYRLDLAQRTFVVPLADDQLVIDAEWCRFVANVWERCQQLQLRCVPIQLSQNAWPLDGRLNHVNFVRAFAELDGRRRNSLIARRLVVELCRYLSDLEPSGDLPPAPVKLFLSHAKADIDVEPKVARELIKALSEDQPIEAWVDSGDITAGTSFSDEIQKGVKDTSLLVVLTDNYAAREWCREEVMLAKEYQRPIAVIDVLTKYEVRSFPYLGNVPRIRWNGDPQAGIDLLLKETLRHLHTAAILNQSRQPGDVVFERPPELATLVGLDPKTKVLYPDPPIGVGEARRLAKTNVNFMTPLQRSAGGQSLKGKLIALSMSESTDIDRLGLDQLHLESSMLDLSRYLLIKGATIAYGGHLGADGYTQKLFELVRTHNDLENVKPFDRIVNYRGWPLPRLSIEQLAGLNRVSRTDQRPRPANIDEALHQDFKEKPTFFSADKSPEHRFAWALGMTEMRAFQSDVTRSGVVARMVLGGTFGPTIKITENGERKEQWYMSRIPGVLEEILLSVQMGQPVFLIGAFGGVARLIIDLLQGKDREEATWEYQKRAPFAPEMRRLYEQRGILWMDYPEIIDLLRRKGIGGINPLLTEDEHLELFDSVDPSRMIEIVLQGLNKCQ